MSPRSSILLSSLLALGVASGTWAQPFALSFTFDASNEKWANQSPIDDHSLSEWSKDAGRTGGGIHMKGTGADVDQLRIWRKVIPNPPKAKRVQFSAWVKGKGLDNLASLVVQAHGSNEGFSSFDAASTQEPFPLKGDFDWTRIETTLDVSSQAKNLQILLLLVGNGEVWFDDVEAKEIGDAVLIEPGLYQAHGKVKINTQSDADAIRLVPMPLSYREQAPVGYSLTVEPPGRLRSATMYEDKPGNWVMRLAIAHPEAGVENAPVVVEWESLVLVAPSSFADVPKVAAYPDAWPEEAKPWLASTLCVQSSHERIRAIAKEIRGESDDVMHVIDATLKRTKTIYEQQSGRCMNLDAVNALDKQGSCTSCANLVAALLRANDIPARILAGYPAWSGPLQTHYIVEAYVPGYGWYPIESTMLQAPWPRHQQIQVSIVPPEYEEKSAMRPQIAGGVPYLSLDERAADSAPFFTLGIVNEKRPYCDHEATVVRNLPSEAPAAEWEEAVRIAKDRWSAWLASKPEAKGPGTLTFGVMAKDVESTSLAELRERLTK